ncbi:hypothetical protein NL676_031664 [Syzygium grande]|nr:hypothetical protein NL676_031664 [Syzygium grande]
MHADLSPAPSFNGGFEGQLFQILMMRFYRSQLLRLRPPFPPYLSLAGGAYGHRPNQALLSGGVVRRRRCTELDLQEG